MKSNIIYINLTVEGRETMSSMDRRIHSNINLSFGDGRLNLDFDPQNRRWKIDEGESEDDSENQSAVTPSLGSVDITKLNALTEKKNEMTKKLIMLKDSKQRLHIQAMVGKMVVAEGIKDFHEQMEILLDKKVAVNTIGPGLLEINRDTLNLALNLE